MKTLKFGLKPLTQQTSASAYLKSLFALKPLPQAPVRTKKIRSIYDDMLFTLSGAGTGLSPLILEDDIIYFGGEPYTSIQLFGSHGVTPEQTLTWEIIAADAWTTDEPDPPVAIKPGPYQPYTTLYDYGIELNAYGGTFYAGFNFFGDRIDVYGAHWYFYIMPDEIHVEYTLQNDLSETYDCELVLYKDVG